MSVTAQLLKVFRVEQQLRGLKSRLHTAEKFLAEQEKQLAGLTAQHTKLASEHKGLRATIAGEETETASIDARMAKLRDQMNNSKTNKEYSAFLAELNSLKGKKDEIEKAELGQMERVEAIKKQVDELAKSIAERETIVAKARKDVADRAAEIKDRVDELSAQRSDLAKDVPGDALKFLADATVLHVDEAMSVVEVIDRRNHEWSCSNCQMTLPVELVNAISMHKLTRCNSCKCILFTEEDVVSKKAPKNGEVDNEDIVKSKKRVAAKKTKIAAADAAKPA
jgi:predicted  nucleic acid-binding Zn-ribbon protein